MFYFHKLNYVLSIYNSPTVSFLSGVTTDSINSRIHDEIVARDAYPSTLNFHGFPKSIATSVNNVAVHGVPDSRPLENGDTVTMTFSFAMIIIIGLSSLNSFIIFCISLVFSL